MTINKWFIAVAAIAISADVAYAADRPWWADRGLYIGAGAGRSGLDSDCEGVVYRAESCEAHYEKPTSTKLFLGYHVRYVALEVSHAWLGTFTETATSQGFTTKRESKPRAFTLQAVGILPVGNNWAAQGWIGLSAMRIPRREETPGAIPRYSSYTDYDFGYVIGAGVRYDFDRNVGVRAGIERHVCCSTYAADWIVYFRSVSVTYQFR